MDADFHPVSNFNWTKYAVDEKQYAGSATVSNDTLHQNYTGQKSPGAEVISDSDEKPNYIALVTIHTMTVIVMLMPLMVTRLWSIEVQEILIFLGWLGLTIWLITAMGEIKITERAANEFMIGIQDVMDDTIDNGGVLRTPTGRSPSTP